MSRAVRLICLCLGAVLLLLPLATGQPGMPPTLKADEPAYLLAALSLIEDGDLVCEIADLRRLVDAYPYLPVENLILMSRDGWQTVYFGKPYLVSLLAAPLVGLFEARGMVLFNMILLLAMVWMGARYLERFNRGSLAMVFSGCFFLLSPAFVYVFWLQPEILNMFGVAASFYLVFHEGWGESAAAAQGRGRLARLAANPWVRACLSAAALALAVYNKPMLAALGLPLIVRLWRRRGWAAAGVWIAAAVVAMGLVAGGSQALTGQPSAYLGAARAGVKIEDPERFRQYLEPLIEISRRAAEEEGVEHASYAWLARIPELFPRMLKENVVYFLFGRHTGFFLYMPFGAAAVLLFLLHGRGSPDRWLTLVSAAGVAFFFLVWIHYNWHGGSGFVGNRYFVNVYPALIFLVTRVRPDWIVVPGSVLAGLFLGPLLFTPYGAPVPEPTLQSHVRGAAYGLFPRELTLRELVPGYDGFGTLGAYVSGRKDLFRVADAAERAVWVRGAETTSIWITTLEPFESVTLEVSSLAPENRVTLEMRGAREVVTLDGATEAERRRVVKLAPKPTKTWWSYGVRYATYRLDVTAAAGRNPRHPSGEVIQPQFYLGAQIVFLGWDGEIAPRPAYDVAWSRIRFPHRLRAGDRLEMLAEVANRGQQPWRARRDLPVRISYRWLTADGQPVVEEGLRSPLGRDLPPGASTRVKVALEAPAEPGSYVLELDAFRDQIGWLSERRAATREIAIDVLPPLYAR